MSEMVERVAKAICEAAVNCGTKHDVEAGILVRLDGEAMARAAIATMREPTCWQNDCGIAALDEIVGNNNIKRAALNEAYRAMIDAALEEKP